MDNRQRAALDRIASRRSTTRVDPGALFTLTADGQAFASTSMFDEISDTENGPHLAATDREARP